MTQAPEFDFDAAIRKLAEAEWKCPGVPNDPGEGIQGGGKSCISGVLFNADDSLWGQCDICGGTGRIVPFASLRIKCGRLRIPNTPIHLHGSDREEPLAHCIYCGIPMPAMSRECLSQTCCSGQDWVPETDVEKACWRILKMLATLPSNPYGVSLPLNEEAVIRAALAWLEEQSTS